jgi:hypothetical protein
MVVMDHDKLRHMLRQSNDMLQKWQARYVHDLQPFTRAMTLAYREGSNDKADPLSRRVDVYAQAKFPLFKDGDVPHSVNHQEQSMLPSSYDALMALQCLDADLISLTGDVLHLYSELSEMVRLGYAKDSIDGDGASS